MRRRSFCEKKVKAHQHHHRPHDHHHYITTSITTIMHQRSSYRFFWGVRSAAVVLPLRGMSEHSGHPTASYVGSQRSPYRFVGRQSTAVILPLRRLSEHSGRPTAS